MAKLKIFLPSGKEIIHDLSEQTTTIGRLAENALQIEDDSVSSSHAEIFAEEDRFFVRDLGSTNGTFINGEKIEKAILQEGDELCFGSVVTLFGSPIAQEEIPTEETPDLPTNPTFESCRPDNFVSSSPIKRDTNENGSGKTSLLIAALVGTVAFAGAIYKILEISKILETQ
jgi:pSer/pThr/pTyr-binding forkhead associated (FHA) protein